jgi:hypothetical protein
MRAGIMSVVCLLVLAASLSGVGVADLGSVPDASVGSGATVDASDSGGDGADGAGPTALGTAETGSNASDGNFGGAVSSFVQSTAAETDSVVDTEMWEGRKAERSANARTNADADANATDGAADGERADPDREQLTRRTEGLRERLADVRTDRRQLVADWRNDEMTDLTFRARMGSLDGRLAGLAIAVNDTIALAERENVTGLGLYELRASILALDSPSAATLIERYPDAGKDPVTPDAGGSDDATETTNATGSEPEAPGANDTPNATSVPETSADASTPTSNASTPNASAPTPNATTGAEVPSDGGDASGTVPNVTTPAVLSPNATPPTPSGTAAAPNATDPARNGTAIVTESDGATPVPNATTATGGESEASEPGDSPPIDSTPAPERGDSGAERRSRPGRDGADRPPETTGRSGPAGPTRSTSR